MEMNAVNFKEMVDHYGGPEKVLVIVFNNAYRQVFSRLDFDYDKHIDAERDLFVFELTEPITGKKIKMLKPIEYVENVLFVDDFEDIEKMSLSAIVG